jgi:hypothetical protein
MDTNQQHIDPSESDKVIWLAREIFTAFPGHVTGLKVYRLGCGCIYYQRLFRDSDIDPQTGIYRDAADGPCDICMLQEETWEERVMDETVVYNSKIQIEAI